MKELDLLKKDWQKNSHSQNQYTESDIYKMLHKKSSSIVKWILIICMIEFSISFVLNLILSDNENLKKVEQMFRYNILDILNIGCYIILIFFFSQFYRNYQRISTSENIKTLIKDIIRTRKTVHQYVWTSIIFAILSGFLISYLLLQNNSEIYNLYINASKTGKEMIFIIVTIMLILILAGTIILVTWLYYKLLYGILLKRLHKNYEELKKIDFD